MKCNLCHEEEQHAAGCPQGELEKLQLQRNAIRCPNCTILGLVAFIDENDDGLLECRECHVQFKPCKQKCCGSVQLYNVRTDKVIVAERCDNRGQGLFPIDNKIMSLEAKVKRISDSRSVAT